MTSTVCSWVPVGSHTFPTIGIVQGSDKAAVELLFNQGLIAKWAGEDGRTVHSTLLYPHRPSGSNDYRRD